MKFSVHVLLIAFAAVPRMIMALARDGVLFGALSTGLARCHSRTGSPVAATLLVGGIFLGVALGCGAVVDCLYAAAYLWFFRYLILHLLALVNRWNPAHRLGAFRRRALVPVAVIGSGVTALAFHFGFAGAHSEYGPRALMVAGAAFVLAVISWWLREPRIGQPHLIVADVR